MMEIKQGDVLIFEAGDNWVSKSIAFLTKSNVSHSAMVYSDDSIVEMGTTGIQVNHFGLKSSGEKAYLLRLHPEHNPAPLIKAAEQYIQEDVEYDFASLVFLAGLLIYRNVRPTPKWKKITDIVLGYACLGLDKLLNRLMHKSNQKVMMCSQLVYQCYYDCGEDYRIRIRDGRLQANLDNSSINTDGSIRIVDLLDENIVEVANQDMVASALPEQIDVEELAKELYESLEEASEVENDLLLDSSELVAISSKAQKFLDLLEKILEKSSSEIPLPALFVTPADILEHAENLEKMGMVQVSRK